MRPVKLSVNTLRLGRLGAAGVGGLGDAVYGRGVLKTGWRILFGRVLGPVRAGLLQAHLFWVDGPGGLVALQHEQHAEVQLPNVVVDRQCQHHAHESHDQVACRRARQTVC